MADFPDQLVLLVELAFGADPDGDPAGWTFTDVSADLLAESVSPTRGTSDEGTEADASTFAFTLDNNSGDYTPGNALSPRYPDVKLNVPCRVSVVDLPVELGGPDPLVRGTGFVSEWLPEWPAGDLSDGEAGEGHAIIAVTVAGILRRLGQGEQALDSAIFRSVQHAANVVAYWPMEDAGDADSFAPGINGVSPMTFNGDVDLAGEDPPGGSKPLPFFRPESGFAGPIPTFALGADDSWNAEWVFRMDESHTVVRDILRFRMTDSTNNQLLLRVSETQFRVQILDDEGTSVLIDDETPHADFFGQWLSIKLLIDGVSSRFNYQVTVRDADLNILHDVTGFTGTTVPRRPTSVGIPTTALLPESRRVGHVVIRNALPSNGFDSGALSGYVGERAAARFERLCDEEGLRCQLIGDPDDTPPMGPQRLDTLLTLLRECAAVDGGIFGETLDEFGLLMRTRRDMYNQTPALVLDAGAGPGEITHPFTPALDDQQVRNDVTVDRPEGSSARAVDEGDVSERGRYSESSTVNVATDGQLPNIAAWRLHLGTWPGMRYPQLSPALNQVPDLIPTWAGLRLGDRVQVINLPPQHPSDAVDLLVQGYTETLTPTSWDATANMSPAGPWSGLFTIEDDDLGRLGGRTYLAGDISDSATSFDVIVPVARPMNPDPDFEQDFLTIAFVDSSSWRSFDLSSFARTSEQAFRGLSSGKGVPDGTQALGEVRGFTIAGPGPAEYMISAWLLAPVGTIEARLILEYRQSLLTVESSFATAFTTMGSTWTRLHVSGATHPSTSFVTIRVQWRRIDLGTLATTDVLYVDDAELGQQGAPWITNAEFSGQLPVMVKVGGEVMSVATIGAPTDGVQTFSSVTRAVNNVTKPHTAGTDVELHPAPRLAL